MLEYSLWCHAAKHGVNTRGSSEVTLRLSRTRADFYFILSFANPAFYFSKTVEATQALRSLCSYRSVSFSTFLESLGMADLPIAGNGSFLAGHACCLTLLACLNTLTFRWTCAFLKTWVLSGFSFHSFYYTRFSSREASRGSSPSRTQNTWRFSANSNVLAGSTPRRGQARSEMWSCHFVLGRPLGRFPMGLASRTCLANISWDILDTWLNQRSWDLSIRRSGSAFRARRISQLRILSRCVTPWALHDNPISAACIWDNTLSVVTQDSWPWMRIGAKTDLKIVSFVVFGMSCFVATKPWSSMIALPMRVSNPCCAEVVFHHLRIPLGAALLAAYADVDF